MVYHLRIAARQEGDNAPAAVPLKCGPAVEPPHLVPTVPAAEMGGPARGAVTRHRGGDLGLPTDTEPEGGPDR